MANLNLVSVIGFIAGALTTAANIPQVWKTYRDKCAEGLSFRMLLGLFSGLGVVDDLWFSNRFPSIDSHEFHRDASDFVVDRDEVEV